MKIYYKIYFLSILFTVSFLFCRAQTSFVYWDSIPVIQWNDTIKYPFAGGFNSPQFSTIDLNGDGFEDLFVFERATNKVYTFLNKGIAGQPDYVYAPQYRKNFPSELNGWVLLRDYNCDGKKDIFTSRNNSFAVYRNDYNTSSGLNFSFIKAFDSNDYYIISVDLPSISDMDNDGDLDILTFDPPGMYLYYYKNFSVDSFGSCDSLNFTLTEHCWGSCSEDFFTCSIQLGDSLSPCRLHNIPPHPNTTTPKQLKSDRHPGNTILTLDLNGDGKKDAIIGPQVCSKAIMLTNCTVPALLDSMIDQTNIYPDSIHPIAFSLFPAVFYEDVNNDGKKDLIAAPNRNACEDTSSAWLYLDTSTTPIPNFEFQNKNFLQSDMIDAGEGSNPVFFDYNGDSLLDLVIGNYYYFSLPASSPGVLALYKNIGTKQSPAFNLITRDYAGISSLNLNGIYPAFGDLDGDGDEDMLIGESKGQLYYFTNTAGKGNPAAFVLTESEYDSIDVGQFSAPQIIDVNCDGRLDLLVGERGGTIKYFENIGRDTSPVFKSTPSIDEFGGIDVMPVCCTGYAVPFLMTDSDGRYELLVGTESDSIYLYTNIENNLNGNFQLSDAAYSGINEGHRASVSGGDLNSDGKMDLVVGNYAGGVAIFKGSEKRPLKNCQPPVVLLPYNINAYPNPVYQSDILNIRISGLSSNDFADIYIYNALGKSVFHNEPTAVFNDWNISIPVDGFAAGLYFLRVSIPTKNDSGDYSLKFVISN